MRYFASPLFAAALLAATALSTATVRAELANDAPVACVMSAGKVLVGLVESCTALTDNPATSNADRLNAMIVRARAYYDNGQTDKALAELDAVTAKDPALARAFRVRGEILRVSGRTVEAFEALNQAIRLEPDNAEGYETRANVFNNAKKYDRAIQDYDEALRLKPDFALAYADRGAAW